MKTIAGGVVIAIAVAVAVVALGTQSTNHEQENMVRVAFFPNMGHSIAIVGMEREIFSEKVGNQTTIKTRLFDSGPQVSNVCK